jgi:hypothetical protein
MSQVTLDQNVAARLMELQECAELIDPLGHVVGYFAPAKPLHATAANQSIPSREELQRYAAEPGGKPLVEILVDGKAGNAEAVDEYVEKSANETDILPAPSLDDIALPMSEFRRNQAFFHESLPKLLSIYNGRYVGVRNGQVVAVGDTLIDTAMAAYAKCGYVSVYVDLVTDKPAPPERFTSPRREVNRA